MCSLGANGSRGLKGPDGNKGQLADKGEKGASGDLGSENLDKLMEELELQLNQNAEQLNLQGNQLVFLKNAVDAQGFVIELQKNQLLQQEKILNHLILRMNQLGFEL